MEPCYPPEPDRRFWDSGILLGMEVWEGLWQEEKHCSIISLRASWKHQVYRLFTWKCNTVLLQSVKTCISCLTTFAWHNPFYESAVCYAFDSCFKTKVGGWVWAWREPSCAACVGQRGSLDELRWSRFCFAAMGSQHIMNMCFHPLHPSSGAKIEAHFGVWAKKECGVLAAWRPRNQLERNQIEL